MAKGKAPAPTCEENVDLGGKVKKFSGKGPTGVDERNIDQSATTVPKGGGLKSHRGGSGYSK
jgi:hypothetical protein